MKFTLALILLSSIFSYSSNTNYASTSYQGRAYDSSQKLDITSEFTSEDLTNYYGDFSSKKGSELQSYLYEKISTDNNFVSYSDVTKWYKITDRNYELSKNKIDPDTYTFSLDTGDNYYLNLLYYTDTTTPSKQINTDVNSYTKDSSLTSGVDWSSKKRKSAYLQVDKEHVFVKSHGFPPQSGKDPCKGAGTDLHHLIAADHNTNNIHNDLYYGEVVSNKKEVLCYYADGTTDISGWTGNSKDGEKVFEPTDQYKGDVARALFYMATRYSKKLDTNTEAEPYLILTDDVSLTDDNANYHGVFHNLSTFLKWNKLDPVSSYEKKRNNLIYYNVQKNRNPFVDYSNLADLIYDPENASSTVTFSLDTSYNIHLNDKIEISLPSLDENTTLSVTNSNEDIVSISNENNKSTITPLKEGTTDLTYTFTTTKDGITTTKEYKTTITVYPSITFSYRVGSSSLYLHNLEEKNINLTTNSFTKINLYFSNLLNNETIELESSNRTCVKIDGYTLNTYLPGTSSIKLYLKSNSNKEELLTITINNSFSTIQIIIIVAIIVFILIIIALIIILTKRKNKSKKSKKDIDKTSKPTNNKKKNNTRKNNSSKSSSKNNKTTTKKK